MSGERELGQLTEAVLNLKSEVKRNSKKLDSFLKTYGEAQLNHERRLTALEVELRNFRRAPFRFSDASRELKITITVSGAAGFAALMALLLKFVGGGL